MGNTKAMFRVAIFFFVVMGLGCSDDEAKSVKATNARIEWSALSAQRLLFAHQSVGADILDGVRDLAERDGVDAPVVNWAGGPLDAGFNNFRVGRNGDPQSKIEAFRVALASVDARPADIAMLKFCYVDFGARTEAKQLAKIYISAYRELASLYPETTFVAVTTPLTVVQTGPKAWIKRAIGVPVGQSVENAKRTEFNNLLREAFGPTHRLFDLAAIEASAGDMRGVTGHEANRTEALDPRLTYDGGHLNREGRQLVASEMLAFLSGISAKR